MRNIFLGLGLVVFAIVGLLWSLMPPPPAWKLKVIEQTYQLNARNSAELSVVIEFREAGLCQALAGDPGLLPELGISPELDRYWDHSRSDLSCTKNRIRLVFAGADKFNSSEIAESITQAGRGNNPVLE